MKSPKPNPSKALLIGLGSAIIVGALFGSGTFNGWQKRLSDLLILPRAATPEIVIAAIDDQSLQAIGRWPWPRTVHAQLTNKLEDLGAKLIVFDVNFAESASGQEDTSLALAIRKAGNVILPVEAGELAYTNGQWQTQHLIGPIPQLRDAALALAHVNITPDSDNIVRRLPASLSYRDKSYQALGILIGNYLNPPVDPQTDKQDRLVINFTGPPKNFVHLPIHQILTGTVTGLENKIVIIGATAADLHDTHLTPTSQGVPMTGVEVHANVAQTVAERSWLREQEQPSTLITILILSLLTSLLVWWFKPIFATLAALGLAAVYFLGNLLLYENGFVGNVLYGLTVLGLAFLGTMIWRYLTETRERERVVKIFGKYVAPKVVDKILAAAKADVVQLGGAKETITVLFADIRGFTPVSEAMEPEAVVDMLNEYLRVFAETIFEYEGTLDKFVGDEVMALYNAPLAQPDHARRAVQTALTALTKVGQLHQTRPDLPKVNFGVGIHSGEAIIGNIGSRERMDFTAIGDTINLGARLMGLAKGGQIIVSQAIYELTKDSFQFKKLEPATVKGKQQPIEIYEVLG